MKTLFRYLSAAVLVVVAALALPPAAGAAPGGGDAFVAGFDDLPLMPALTQDPDGTLVFDSPYGRVVEARARGHVAAASVLDFYRGALPQLGWRPGMEAGTWRREGEVLTLDVKPDGGAVTVRFQVAPTD